eukprot:TRINITY_DN1982_c0_g2_i4.p1 TRINITY_DN1982_c0_g2~~TRINITY_DN1982_c0_g2_i4.p1  ORF type:complete len:350 (+),score=100.34 TRINITY_DN1982_c0_g2_i4:183-1232(+)
MEALRREAKRIIKDYGGALIEEYIAGPEFTVLAAENANDPSHPIVYQPVQCVFPRGETFKHFDLKWKDYEGFQWKAVEDNNLSERLKEMAGLSLIHMMNGRAYGSIDVRQRESDGELFFLEINPQPAIFYPEDEPGSCDQILTIDPHHNHVTFLENMIQAALNHYNASQRAKNISFVKAFPNLSGYGLFASREIQEGELVQEGESQPYFLVSKKHINSASGRSDPKLNKWFSRYAYPVNETLFVTWSSTPEEWRPINHSCDPNCWLSGLDLIARRGIKKGEELTMDYATFCAENMEPFECKCNSKGCRGLIGWNEDQLPNIVAKYGDHVSDYIADKVRRIKKSSSVCLS